MEEKKICKFFLEGKCKFGDKCHNLHIIPQNNENNPLFNDLQPHKKNHPTKNSICTFFLNNKCTRKNCPFFHGYENNLQYITTFENEKEINNLLVMDDNIFISCGEQSFIIRSTDNKERIERLNKEGYKIGIMIYSGHKIIFGLSKKD